MSDVLEVLASARELISDPAKWGKGLRGVGCARPRDTYCAAEAIEEVSEGSSRQRAYYRVMEAAGIGHGLPNWNDAPERTHDEVIAVFYRAIELEKKQTGEV